MKTKATRLAIGIASASAILLGWAVPAGAETTYDFSFASPGSGAGELNDPSGVAVNHDTGDVYVADRANNRIVQFDSDGDFIRTWGEDVNQTSGGDLCTAASGDTCKAGERGGAAGAFISPRGIAVDNSGGPASGSVYVQDAGNFRLQRFTATGQLVVMWGKEVNLTTGGHICTAASGDACQAGKASGSQTPLVPSVPGQFAAFPDWIGPSLAVDGAGNVYAGDPEAVPYRRVQKFDPSGAFLAQIAGRDNFPYGGIAELRKLAVNSAGDAYVVAGFYVSKYDSADFTPTGETASWDAIFDFVEEKAIGLDRRVPETVAIDPLNEYLFLVDEKAEDCAGGPGQARIREFHPGGQEVDCSAPSIAIDGDQAQGMAVSPSHRLYLADDGQDRVHVFQTPVATAPAVGGASVSEITSSSARVDAEVAANLEQTTFHVEYGSAGPCSANPCASTDESSSIGAAIPFEPVTGQLNGLDPATTYFYRVVATNDEGTVAGTDHSFTTFPAPQPDPSCPNHLARQQTKASLLLDCRAYELVSAQDTGGYNVSSNLIAGQQPYGGYPQAEDKALYSVHNGGIPGTGRPTNRGPDPYVATRDAANQRWNTTYVGIPADAPSSAPFSSTLAGADSMLSSFAFSGAEICNPCFADGSQGIPLRLPDGSLIQGMAGSIPVALPVSVGAVTKHLSADATHFLFGSRQQFEPAGNPDDGNVTIYDRELVGGTTQVVSTLPDGSTIAAGSNVAALDISADGSRVLIGRLVRTDTAGNRYWDLFMHVGASPNSIEIVDSPGGALYAGMSSDGTEVYLTTPDALTTAADQDTDASADLYRADVDSSSATLTRVSTGEPGTGDTDSCAPVANSAHTRWNSVGATANCDVVAVGGGGGVAQEDGSAYFLSPERLDTSGPAQPRGDHPNLYLARPGQSPQFVATLEANHNFGAFTKASGIAVEQSTGNVYVANIGATNRVVRKFDANGNPVPFTAGPNAGTNQLTGADAPCTAFAFNQIQGTPAQLAVDQSTGNLYVPDTGSGKVDVFSSTGDCLSQISVASPTGVAVNPTSGNVYVASGTGASSSIRVFTPAGAAVTSFSVSANSPGPKGVAVDSKGNVYVVNNARAALYDPSGAFVRVLDPNPSFGVAVDSSDDVFVNEGDKLARFDSGGASLGDPLGVGTLTGSVGIALSSSDIYATNRAGASIARFGSDLKPKAASDSSLVLNSVKDTEVRQTADFQATPSGDQALFASTLPLTGFDSEGRFEVFHYDAPSETLACTSCDPTGANPPTSDARLAQNGLSLTEDGRAFFDTGEQLVQRDANSRRDVYEWKEGTVELISTGTSAFDSGLLSVSSDGTDAFFFTRERLVSTDLNGSLMKLYTAREEGGFFLIPPPPPCVASDECHEPGTQATPPAPIGTLGATPNNFKPQPKPKPCRRGQVRRRGRCVKRPSKRRQRAAKAKRRGGK